MSPTAFCASRFADVEILGGGTAPCSLFCLTIAESGERKSTCDRLLMAGIRDHEAREAVSYAFCFPRNWGKPLMTRFVTGERDMAQDILTLSISFERRWWVPLYFTAMRVFIFCWAAFADVDDMSAWIEREVQWVIQHGYRLIVVPS